MQLDWIKIESILLTPIEISIHDERIIIFFKKNNSKFEQQIKYILKLFIAQQVVSIKTPRHEFKGIILSLSCAGNKIPLNEDKNSWGASLQSGNEFTVTLKKMPAD